MNHQGTVTNKSQSPISGRSVSETGQGIFWNAALKSHKALLAGGVFLKPKQSHAVQRGVADEGGCGHAARRFGAFSSAS
jgi:hypothetical protein